MGAETIQTATKKYWLDQEKQLTSSIKKAGH